MIPYPQAAGKSRQHDHCEPFDILRINSTKHLRLTIITAYEILRCTAQAELPGMTYVEDFQPPARLSSDGIAPFFCLSRINWQAGLALHYRSCYHLTKEVK